MYYIYFCNLIFQNFVLLNSFHWQSASKTSFETIHYIPKMFFISLWLARTQSVYLRIVSQQSVSLFMFCSELWVFAYGWRNSFQGSPTTQQSHLTKRRHSTSVISRQTANQVLIDNYIIYKKNELVVIECVKLISIYYHIHLMFYLFVCFRIFNIFIETWNIPHYDFNRYSVYIYNFHH